MKIFFCLLAYFIITTVLMLNSDIFSFKEEYYVNQKVLDLSVPLNVTIDTELLNSLKPANEQ